MQTLKQRNSWRWQWWRKWRTHEHAEYNDHDEKTEDKMSSMTMMKMMRMMKTKTMLKNGEHEEQNEKWYKTNHNEKTCDNE